jgi:magnesium-transporting ATPase (P-type)
MLLAICVDRIILSSVILAYLNIVSASIFAILIGAAETAFVMFLLARPRVASLRASPPYGWALGLGIGSMQASYLIYRLFDKQLQYSEYSGVNVVSLTMAFAIALVSCLGHALPASWQGSRILESSRVRPFIISAIARGALTMCLILSLFVPLTLLLTAPAIVLAWRPAQTSWLPSGMTPAAKQAFRRTTRQSHRHRMASDERIRGQVVDSEE